jgi:thioredoxin reductase (NADPH)
MGVSAGWFFMGAIVWSGESDSGGPVGDPESGRCAILLHKMALARSRPKPICFERIADRRFPCPARPPADMVWMSIADRPMPDQSLPAANRTRLMIIGAGPAGYTAAIYAARAALEPVLVAGLQPGGQLMITTDVENYPGFAEVIQGPFLMEQMAAQAEHVGTRIIHDLVASVDFAARPFRCVLDSGQVWLADAVIVATGAQARWLGLESEQRLQGAGVSACATCDGFFYRGKRVAVVGGGNTAVEEALYLTHHASHVTLIHRRASLRAERILQQRLFAHPKISVVWDSVVEEITASGTPPTVDGVRLRDVNTGAETSLSVDGVFVAIGHTPTTALFAGQIAMDAEGYVQTVPGSTRTSVEGVFAAGDVQDKVFRQAVTAAGTGCMAALEAEKYLAALSETPALAAE